MLPNDPQVCLEQLAHRYGLRWIRKAKRFLGIHRGIILDAAEHEGILGVALNSPTAEIGEALLAGFAGFVHTAEAGVPTDWLKAHYEPDAKGRAVLSDHGCRICVDQRCLDYIGEELFLRIPEIVGDDLRAHGASEVLPCADCGRHEATSVGLHRFRYVPLCDECRSAALRGVPGGRWAAQRPVNWGVVLPLVAILTAAGGYLWGYVQQPQRLDKFTWNAVLLPAAWAIGLCAVTFLTATRVTRMLRLLLFGSVIISVLCGNIWGFRSRLIEGQRQLNQGVNPPGWPATATLYLTALPRIWRWEAPLLMGGVLGAWIAMGMLKRDDRIHVE